MVFPVTALDVRVQVALDGPDLSDPTTWSWTDATSWVRRKEGISITIGRRDGLSQMPPSTMALTVDNADGRWTRTNPTGAWYGRLTRNTPIRVQVNNGSGYTDRFTGTIDAFPPRWDHTGQDAVANLTASGALRRMGLLGSTRSALFRTHTTGYYGSGEAVAYWPCEDARGATSLASAITGHPAAVFGGADFTPAADSTIVGSSPLPTIGANGFLRCTVPAYPAATRWAVRAVMKIPTGASGALLFWGTPSGTGNIQWALSLGSGTDLVTIAAINSAGTDVIGHAGVTLDGIRGQQLYIEANAVQDGADIDWSFTIWFPSGEGGGGIGTLAGATVGNVTQVHLYNVAPTALGDATIGHIAVATDPFYGASVFGATGFAGEDTGSRWLRAAAELSLPWDWEPAAATPMGAQPTDTTIGQIREIGDAEGVPVYDSTAGFLYLPARTNRYNADVALTLSFTGSQIQPPQPTDDDRYIRNDVTVTRRGGSSARRTQRTGPNSVAVGTYEAAVTLNVEQDADLPFRADWLRHLGTVDELRYPQVDINMASGGMATAIDDWLLCAPGSRVQLADANLPGLAPDTVDLILEGWTEFLRYPLEWKASLNCSPYAPWSVFELEDDTLGRLETSGSELTSGVTSSATSMFIATTGSPVVWSTTAEPYDLHVAGERVTVTNMVTNAATFVAAGAAAHGDNATLAPALPASVTAGDLLLVFAAIRNTAAAPSIPVGYSRLADLGNVALFGKYHSGTESAPSVSFAGGAAGDTTSAQMGAFRNCQINVHAAASASNAAAANITTPACTISRNRCVVLTLGWKQDDWTSVATIAGMTEIGEPSSTTGSDQGLVWDYVIQTTAAQISASSFVVTGGTNQIGKGAVVALLGDVQTATVTRAVNGVSKAQSAAAAVTLWRPGSGGLAL
jgi:hypothetical protein